MCIFWIQTLFFSTDESIFGRETTSLQLSKWFYRSVWKTHNWKATTKLTYNKSILVVILKSSVTSTLFIYKTNNCQLLKSKRLLWWFYIFAKGSIEVTTQLLWCWLNIHSKIWTKQSQIQLKRNIMTTEDLRNLEKSVSFGELRKMCASSKTFH